MPPLSFWVRYLLWLCLHRLLTKHWAPERVLRYLAATNVIKESAANEYTANMLTHVLADPKGEAMIYHG